MHCKYYTLYSQVDPTIKVSYLVKLQLHYNPN